MSTPTSDGSLFPNFQTFDIDVGGVSIHGVTGGSGPPVLLLHGYPQTHAIWHKVAGELAKTFTVVATDLTGYGDSSKPASSAPDHAPYRKAAMARDQLNAMNALGHSRFHLVGHDRGGRVAHRLVLNHPEAVQTLTTLDIAPTLHMYQNTSDAFARAYWHWFFMIKAAPVPETMIGADPTFFLRQHMSRGPRGVDLFDPIFAEYERCFSDPAAIHAACEDYRASATVDLAEDAADLGKLRIKVPMLALWGAQGAVGKCFNVLESWRDWADDLRGAALPSGHYIPEEVPQEFLDMLLKHLR
jgi:haloacetate dehalogenase